MASKQSDLMRLPLWECQSCWRLECSEPTAGDDWGGEDWAVGPTCHACDEEMEPVEKEPLTTWEAVAQHFYRDTGFLRMGKDDCRGVHTDEEREAAFRKWDQGQ